MMKPSLILCAAIVLVLAGCSSGGSAKPTPHSITTGDGTVWDLVWSDEFEGEGLPDSEKWSYEVGSIRNNELQYYTESRVENARMEGGYLVIESRKEDYEGAQYSSASLTTDNRASWTYGRIEVSAKLPVGVGMWPAIWMLGVNIDDVGWPTCGEIDIMENVGYERGSIHGTVHTEAYNHVKGTAKGGSLYRQSAHDEFHLYAIEWFEDRIDFYVDDVKYFSFANDGKGDNATWPFDKPHYLILNAAIGGSWGGQYGVDDEIFPAQYLIDYVRVYKLRK